MKFYVVQENCRPYWDNGSTSFNSWSVWPLRSKKQALAKYSEVKKQLDITDQVVLSEWETKNPAQIFNNLKQDGQAPDALYNVADSVRDLDWETNQGESLNGAILVTVSHERYVNYATNFHGIDWADSDKFEADLIDSGNHERTGRSFQRILLSANETEGLTGNTLLEAVVDELERDSWKWTGFRTKPISRDDIIDSLSIKDVEHPYTVSVYENGSGEVIGRFWNEEKAQKLAKEWMDNCANDTNSIETFMYGNTTEVRIEGPEIMTETFKITDFRTV